MKLLWQGKTYPLPAVQAKTLFGVIPKTNMLWVICLCRALVQAVCALKLFIVAGKTFLGSKNNVGCFCKTTMLFKGTVCLLLAYYVRLCFPCLLRSIQHKKNDICNIHKRRFCQNNPFNKYEYYRNMLGDKGFILIV